MQCPRCGADNSEGRVACWNCYAQLRPAQDAKPEKAEAKKPEKKGKKAEPEQVEQAAPPIEEPDAAAEEPIAPAPLVAEEQPATEESTVLDLDAASAPVIDFGSSETQVVDLSESPLGIGYVVPGLAEPEEKQEEIPAVEAPDLPVFDPDNLEPVAPPPPKPEPPAPTPRVMRERPKKEKPSGRRGIPAVIPLLIIMLAILAAAWWFFLGKPSPAPVAKSYIEAVGVAISGDTSKLKAVCTASSQQQIDTGFQAMKNMKMPGGFTLQVTAGDVTNTTVTGNTAIVTINASYGIGTSGVKASMPMRVALVKEGSFIKPQWKVDMNETNRLAQEDAKAMMQKMFPGGMPSGVPMPR